MAPTCIHQHNTAERSVRTFKDNFLSGLFSTDTNFLMKNWDHLLEQSDIPLNLLCPSSSNPILSVYVQLSGAFDFNRTPIATPVTITLMSDKPHNRDTWNPHRHEVWYVSPEMLHYLCITSYIPKTEK